MFKNQRGFTLIEMLIVLMIISVLIILIVPNLADKSQEVNEKGCDALVTVVQAQSDAYFIEKNSHPTIQDLVSNNYINDDQQTCPDGTALTIATNGIVSRNNETE
ncbi:competence type IV pilus major pilin ComGC [Lentibacillus jeotgali]|uniref:competence type IV pilus major pilin ComGC n=1 Tax=Lentibacillus jeotgali TaxID=558169 RepID=UPI0002626078|nr:competence type IV pilus major pilin ComGC [Lentibacillus jeotgali]